MAFADTPTKLPLATFAKILGLNPLHFEGISFTPDRRSPQLCESAIFQYPWQESGRIGREEIAIAIAQAEEKIEAYLGFPLIPTWIEDEWQLAARSGPGTLIRGGRDVRGFSQVVKAKWGKVLTGGVQKKTLLLANAPIVWDDNDGLFVGVVTVPINLATTATCDIEVYYPGKDGADAYQIRPANVTVSGSNAVITFARELCVDEALYRSLNPEPADYDDDSDFIDEVDVYWRRNDPSKQAILMWDPAGCSACGGFGCSTCAYTVQNGCLHLRSTPKEAILGWTAAEWNVDSEQFEATAFSVHRVPDIVRLFYYAGNVAPTGCPRTMERKWAEAVTYLAVASLDRPMCTCTENLWQYWREDLTLLSGGEGDQTNTYSFDTRRIGGENPLGPTRGALEAWRRIKEPGVAKVDVGVF